MYEVTSKYVVGMQAVNNYYEMLYQALSSSLPSAWLAQSGAYVWRGYRIIKYQDLAGGQYYCQDFSGIKTMNQHLIQIHSTLRKVMRIINLKASKMCCIR